MDIQLRVAARRAELTQIAKEEEERAQAEESRRLEAERRQRVEEVDALATELSTANAPLMRNGETLELKPDAPLPGIDVAALRTATLKSLLKREARKRWTIAENWIAISTISAGLVLLLPLAPLGALLLLFGLFYGNGANERHQQRLVTEYPELFGQFRKVVPKQ